MKENDVNKKINNNYAWVTLVATDNFAQGAIILAKSLKKVKSKYPLYIIATNNLSPTSFALFEENNIPYRVFPYMSFYCNGERNQNYYKDIVDQNKNARWNCTICKLYMFLFSDFDKVCYLDADIEFIQNCDYYFNYPHFSAFKPPISEEIVPWGGTIVIEPNEHDFIRGLKISSQLGVVNDEMIWDLMHPQFKYDSRYYLPFEDFSVKFHHHDGPIKPWMENCK